MHTDYIVSIKNGGNIYEREKWFNRFNRWGAYNKI